MIAKYYTQITFQRMSEILGYTIEVCFFFKILFKKKIEKF